MFSNWIKALWAFLLLATVAQAQFQFFEHMFGGGGPRQARQEDHQDGPSDSSWYEDRWENGKFANIVFCSYPKLEDQTNVSFLSPRRL